ncbi:MAG: bifunctional diaminohydroxyphosphoribosylaminopyrimidine deaminase/5-amino-6-(5-phosphoribosylamino)uracil reductase RibD [Eubacterium sp.]|nr:bifunctional diaminohydroxyphosphoribosylaminopyrimidine deaminase/5-amino-6-(5-phosphoribosylamino)uracil reductase RibD [Eubacterium sp.]
MEVSKIDRKLEHRVEAEKYMRRALELAERGRGCTGKNPMVGAVITKNGKIISEGWHERYGEAHAEDNAISKADINLEGATMYVNLEPCSHFGKRPPCCELIKKHKFKKVYVGSLDPNPLVAGAGIEKLRAAGIEVDTGILKEECDRLNEVFFYHITHKKPFVLMKYAMTMDGKIACVTGDSKWISSEASRRRVHQLRANFDAVMVGIGTVKTDNPSLNVRMVSGRDPVRIIVDSKLSIDESAYVLHLKSNAKTIIATTEFCDTDKKRKLKALEGVEVLETKKDGEHVDLEDLLEKLYQCDITSILLEGGGELNYSMLSKGLINKVNCFVSPKIVGGRNSKTPVAGLGIELMENAVKLDITDVEKIGDDVLMEAKIVYRNC